MINNAQMVTVHVGSQKTNWLTEDNLSDTCNGFISSGLSLSYFFTSVPLMLLTWEAAAGGGVVLLWSGSFFCLKKLGCLALEVLYSSIGTFFKYVKYQAVHQAPKVSRFAAGH